MKLYNYNSTSPRRVRIFLAEKGVEIPMQEVDITKGEHKSDWFMKKNIMGAVPVLELDDGFCIPDSLAICRYLEAIYPDPPLFGSTLLQKAMVDVWLQRLEMNFLMQVAQVWMNDSPVTRPYIKDPNLKAAETGREGARRLYELMNTHLADNEFLAGDFYSAADVSGLALMDFAAIRVPIPYSDELTHLKRWHKALSARPSALAGLPVGVEPF